MRKSVILLLFILIASLTYAQESQQNADMKIGNYIIKTPANTDHTYGLEIYDQSHGKIILQQKSKPYSSNNKGFNERQNAVVAGLWFVNELQQGRNDIKKLTTGKAKELGITNADL